MSVISHMMYRRNHSPGRGLTICQPWELPNNFSLLYNCSSLSSNRQGISFNFITPFCKLKDSEIDDMMDSESFKSGHPTRHIALFSVNLLTIGHEELFKQLQVKQFLVLAPYFLIKKSLTEKKKSLVGKSELCIHSLLQE